MIRVVVLLLLFSLGGYCTGSDCDREGAQQGSYTQRFVKLISLSAHSQVASTPESNRTAVLGQPLKMVPPPANPPVVPPSIVACTARASGTSYYVSPDGNGNCTITNPCSLDTGLGKAGPGDEVALKDGEYRQAVTTRRDGAPGRPIIIRAENPLRAVITPPPSDTTSQAIFNIKHSYITVQGVTLNSQKQCCFGNFQVRHVEIGTGKLTENVVLEGNHIVNGSGPGFYVFDTKNIVIRHNVVDGTGYKWAYGESFYVSKEANGMGFPHGPRKAIGGQIYGNIIRDGTADGFELKTEASQFDVHHNIFERMGTLEGHNARGAAGGWGGTSFGAGGPNHTLIIVSGANNRFHDNIIRDQPPVNIVINTSDANNEWDRNVFFNIQNSIVVGNLWSNTNAAGITRVHHNTFCGLKSYASPAPGQKWAASINVKVVDNVGIPGSGAPMSACDAEAARILGEMKSLPSCGQPAR